MKSNMKRVPKKSYIIIVSKQDQNNQVELIDSNRELVLKNMHIGKKIKILLGSLIWIHIVSVLVHLTIFSCKATALQGVNSQ